MKKMIVNILKNTIGKWLMMLLWVIAMSWMLNGCSSSEKMIQAGSNWQAKSINPDELKSVPETADIYYLTEQDLHYSMSNDHEYLYVSLELSEREDKIKTLLFGATLWINSDGKKKEKMGIRYPLTKEKPDSLQSIRNSDMLREPDPEKAQNAFKELIKSKDQLEMVNISGKGVEKIHHLSPHGPNALIWMDEQRGNLMYTARIPLKYLDVNQNSGDSSQRIAIGFQTGALDLPDRGQISGGRTRRGGGGGRRRPSANRLEHVKKLQESTEFWFRYEPATKQ